MRIRQPALNYHAYPKYLPGPAADHHAYAKLLFLWVFDIPTEYVSTH